MSKFYERPPLFSHLNKEFKKVSEFGSELSDKVDKIVVGIKSAENKKEKQKMMEELLVRIHPLLEREVSYFYKRFHGVLSKRGVAIEDVYNGAIESLVKCVDIWDDQKTRDSKNKQSAHFTSFFFHKHVLPSRLRVAFIEPALRKMRNGKEVSMNQPVSGFEDNGEKLQDILPDQRSDDSLAHALKKEEIKIGKDAVFNKLYTSEDPFLSLVVILRFGFGEDILNKWKAKTDLSIKREKIKKTSQKHISKIDQIMEGYTGEDMTLQQIGDLVGLSRQGVDQKLAKALKILKEQLENKV